MKISDILKEDKVTLTYEVFPPRRNDTYESVAEKARTIAELHPAFMSVTYGAGRRHERVHGGAGLGYLAALRRGVAGASHLRVLDETAGREGAP